MSEHSHTADDAATPPTRKQELLTFPVHTIVLAPVVAIMLVGGYGFLIWIVQIIVGHAGPPGPPGT
ncbi:MAG: periplasmic nitrate reductase, NapE protein [Gammaproteobacteria bacterium]